MNIRNFFTQLLCMVGSILCMGYVLKTHQASLQKSPQPESQKEFVFHEIDQQFLKQLDTFEQQLEQFKKVLSHIAHEKKVEDAINHAHETAEFIKTKYSKNSPATAFLGPIGTTAIVIKEVQLEHKLLRSINKMGILLHDAAPSLRKTPYEPARTIDEGLKKNAELLKLIG